MGLMTSNLEQLRREALQAQQSFLLPGEAKQFVLLTLCALDEQQKQIERLRADLEAWNKLELQPRAEAIGYQLVKKEG